MSEYMTGVGREIPLAPWRKELVTDIGLSSWCRYRRWARSEDRRWKVDASRHYIPRTDAYIRWCWNRP